MEKLSNFNNQLKAFLNTKRISLLFFGILFVFFIGLLGLLYIKNNKLELETVSLKDNLNRCLRDFATISDSSENTSKLLKEVDIQEINRLFHTDLTKFIEGGKSVSCAEAVDIQNLYASNYYEGVSQFIEIIKNHLYSDPFDPSGVKSKKEIINIKTCNSGDNYFFLYNTSDLESMIHIPVVNAAGGMGQPSYFAYKINSQNLQILEPINYSQDLDRINLPEDETLPKTTNSIAYYECQNIYLTNGSEAIIGCGGGDGGAGGYGAFVVNLKNKSIKEVAFCFNGQGKYSTRCFDQNSKLYFQELNPDEILQKTLK